MLTQEIIKALDGQKLQGLNYIDKLNIGAGVLQYIYSLCGYTVADNVQQEIELASGILIDRISSRWPHLTVDEIRLALELGVTGHFGKDKRLTMANYIEWLGKYNVCQERAEAVQQRLNAGKRLTESQAARLLTTGEIVRRNEEAGKASAIKEYSRFCQTGKLDILCKGYGAMIYDYLYQRGCLDPSDEVVRQAYVRSRDHVRGPYAGTNKIVHLANEALKMTDKASDLMDYSTKCELLTMYFSTLKSRGMALNL